VFIFLRLRSRDKSQTVIQPVKCYLNFRIAACTFAWHALHPVGV